MKAPKKTIRPNAIKVRDYAMVAIIKGATKSGAHTDRKKAQNKQACRKAAVVEE